MDLSQRDVENLYSEKERLLNVAQWKDKKQKFICNSGQEYTNKRGKRKLIAAKELPTRATACDESCKKTGCRNLSLNTVHELNKRFYQLNYNEQQLFLQKFIDLRDVKIRRPEKTVATSHKLAGFDFSINNKPVCRATLLHVFSISIKRIRVLQAKLKAGETRPRDQRGRHLKRPHAVDNNIRDLIREHIRSFPILENHYSLNISTKNYLSMDLSVQMMHRLFKEKYEQPATYSLYRKIFIREFNLRFGSPRSDTCKLCDQLFAKLVLASTDNERQQIQEESRLHHMKADSANKQLAEDGSNPNYTTLCIDLQQVLFTPMLTHSNVYYQRQYSNYNFAIHNMSSNQANMFKDLDNITKKLFLTCKKFQVTKYVWFKMCKDDIGSVYIRESHNSLRPWKIFNIFKPDVELPMESALPQLYSSPIPIEKEKKKDLLTMMQLLVNPEHKLFYRNLPTV